MPALLLHGCGSAWPQHAASPVAGTRPAGGSCLNNGAQNGFISRKYAQDRRRLVWPESILLTVKQEIVVGLATFMTMAYIIFVNPAILSSAGMPP